MEFVLLGFRGQNGYESRPSKGSLSAAYLAKAKYPIFQISGNKTRSASLITID